MRLDRILRDADVLPGTDPRLAEDFRWATLEVTGVTHRTESVRRGSLYCCLPGSRADGHDFAPAAVEAGAVALLCERPLELDVAQVLVPDARRAMAQCAAVFHGRPSQRLAVVGITGTNGKTTTAAMLACVLGHAGIPTEVIGTLGGHDAAGPGTTPESSDLQARLAALVDQGVQAVALEVSSHALVQRRVDAVEFAVGIFTNLSPEHLDYHADMEEYFLAKARLFEPERSRVGVVNADDPWGQRLLATAAVPTRPFRLADAVDLQHSAGSSSFVWAGERVRLELAGRANVANALAAATAARQLGVPAPQVAAGLGFLTGVPGRLERVPSVAPFTVVVDYAHTPAALEACLEAAAAMAGGGRVLVVFGCGGGRDRTKRPVMGEVATRLGDRAFLTSDNPRYEDPLAIIQEVVSGVVNVERLVVEPDRRNAIAAALADATPGDVVVLAGKGHEATQTVGSRLLPFDDRAVAAGELERLGW